MSLADALVLSPPDGFIEEEVVTTFRAPAREALHEPRLLQKQTSVRANLIAVQRRVGPKASLAELMSAICADLVRNIEGLSDIETTEFEFTDGARGILLRYQWPLDGKLAAFQLQAGRLDAGVFTTLTLTTEASRLTDSDLKAYLLCITSASVRSP